ncbi:hypothetical protein [Flavobacterium sp. NRK1]|uniref:hypothetical protein n=1 Tax=Flavobacterium sp. NRK1 TaxID=2954929 RepID=UPI0020924C9B|nr:hypothetical protein [Flavobacterium sp. NRK1]MCO6146735.1 hypothetical protein [Flavobacterium sp. NRK1]
MQTKSIYDKGIQITAILFSFSMFVIITNPLKFSWITSIFGSCMLYFAIQKLRNDKKKGQSIEKARNLIILAGGGALISTACFIASLFI